MSNWNEISAENLRGWIKQQEEMLARSEEHLDGLVRLKASHARASAVPSQRTWLDDAIEREGTALEQLRRSMDKSKEWLGLAELGILHDPNL